MSAEKAALYAVLAGDATLVGMLSEYDAPGPQPDLPAIFSSDPIPEGASDRFLLIRGPITQEPVLDSNEIEYGREVSFDVALYFPQDGDTSPIDAASERARALLHRQPLAVAGKTWVDTRVSGPIVADEVDLFGRILTARILLDG